MKYRMLERIAFALVVTSALVCVAYIAYERNPATYALLHDGMKALQSGSELPAFALSSPGIDEPSSINMAACR